MGSAFKDNLKRLTNVRRIPAFDDTDIIQVQDLISADGSVTFVKTDGSGISLEVSSGGGSGSGIGDISSSSDNAIVRWDGTDGDTVQNSVVFIDDQGNITGLANVTASGNLILNSSVFSDNAVYLSPDTYIGGNIVGSGNLSIAGNATISGSLTLIGTFNATTISGSWSGDTIPVTKGGTSLTSVPTNALLVGQGTSALSGLELTPNEGWVLTRVGGEPAWAAPSGGGGSTINSLSGVFTATVASGNSSADYSTIVDALGANARHITVIGNTDENTTIQLPAGSTSIQIVNGATLNLYEGVYFDDTAGSVNLRVYGHGELRVGSDGILSGDYDNVASNNLCVQDVNVYTNELISINTQVRISDVHFLNNCVLGYANNIDVKDSRFDGALNLVFSSGISLNSLSLVGDLTIETSASGTFATAVKLNDIVDSGVDTTLGTILKAT